MAVNDRESAKNVTETSPSDETSNQSDPANARVSDDHNEAPHSHDSSIEAEADVQARERTNDQDDWINALARQMLDGESSSAAPVVPSAMARRDDSVGALTLDDDQAINAEVPEEAQPATPLVTAKRTSPRPPVIDSVTVNQPLLQALGIKYNELNANRNGLLSRGQLWRYGRVRQNRVLLLIAVVVAVVHGALFALDVLPRGWVVGSLIVILGGLAVWITVNMLRDDSLSVLGIQGHVFRLGPTGRQGLYQIRVFNMDFEVSQAVHDAFQPDQPYHAYYIRYKNKNVLLSAESY